LNGSPVQEEAAREQKVKEEEAANAEFDKWKSAFVVDTEGTLENDVQEESQGLLLDFVEYIKVRSSGPAVFSWGCLPTCGI
jgi:hypothetical protein